MTFNPKTKRIELQVREYYSMDYPWKISRSMNPFIISIVFEVINYYKTNNVDRDYVVKIIMSTNEGVIKPGTLIELSQNIINRVKSNIQHIKKDK